MNLVLRGTEEELSSSRAKKVIMVASYVSASVTVEISTPEQLKALHPLASSLVLSVDSDSHITSSNAMMRAVANLSPASGLLGRNDFENAVVDGWLSFIWSSMDLPLYVLEMEAMPLPSSLEAALTRVESQLCNQKYLTGDKISLADISLAVSLSASGNPSLLANRPQTSQWLNDLTCQRFWVELT